MEEEYDMYFDQVRESRKDGTEYHLINRTRDLDKWLILRSNGETDLLELEDVDQDEIVIDYMKRDVFEEKHSIVRG
jgi:hypothetical protein